jgi:hypothetical protein
LQALSRIGVAVVPYPQAEVLELLQDEDRIESLCERNAAISARPSMTIPVIVGAKNQADRVECMRALLQHYGFEPIGDVSRNQLTPQLGQSMGKSRAIEEARTYHALNVGAIPALRRGFPLHVQQSLFDVAIDCGSSIEPRCQQRHMLGKGSAHQTLLLIEETKK